MPRVRERFVFRAPSAPPRYDQTDQNVFRSSLERFLARLLSHDDDQSQPIGVLEDGDTTPAVPRKRVWKTNNSAPTTITDFLQAQQGQEIEIIALDANTTVQDGAGLQLQGGGNYVMNANDTLRLIHVDGVWYEIGRSQN